MNARAKLIIGTRGSDLALYQAHFIAGILWDEHRCEIELKIIKTSGDRIDNLSFDKMEGKGFFTKELEDALLSNEIDLAVHSLKDLMTTQPNGLKLGAVGYRTDKRELLLIRPEAYEQGGLLPVKSGKTIGTSAARRKAQIAYHNPSLAITDLRGNVPTRVNRLREGKYDAILIAAAGVNRLNLDLSDLVAVPLDANLFLPAPAQGILGIQIRENDERVEKVVNKLGSQEAWIEVSIERGLLSKFNSGCSLPLGVFSRLNKDCYYLKAVLGERNGEVWTGLRQVEVTGAVVSDIVNRAYEELNRAKVCHA